MKAPVDWRKHPRFFRCRCATCMTKVDPIAKRLGLGKFWQARYGESNLDFHQRYNAAHTGATP